VKKNIIVAKNRSCEHAYNDANDGFEKQRKD
jgi:hypothetical protein